MKVIVGKLEVNGRQQYRSWICQTVLRRCPGWWQMPGRGVCKEPGRRMAIELPQRWEKARLLACAAGIDELMMKEDRRRGRELNDCLVKNAARRRCLN